MKLKSNIIDPYVGQEAEGKKIKFESVDKIEVEELKVFLFDNIIPAIINIAPTKW